MSKRDLKKYLQELTKKQLEEQVLDLYTRFIPVKTYYNFVFKPNEQKMLDEAKFKISKEYFPLNSRKAKTRRSVAQKNIKHFIQLGVDSYIVADLMLYNIEIAQRFSAEKEVKQEAFFKSMLRSFEEAVSYLKEHGMLADFLPRINQLIKTTNEQKWINSAAFHITN